MGWTFDWLSSGDNAFNYDYAFRSHRRKSSAAATTISEPPGSEARKRPASACSIGDEAGNIFHTYSCFARGLDMMNAAYHYLDLTPLGRHEDGLPYPMTGCGYVTNTSRRRFRHPAVTASRHCERSEANPSCCQRRWIAHMGNVCVKDEQSPFCSTAATSSSRREVSKMTRADQSRPTL